MYCFCFKIVKILLKYGANPDLRDEEGKTALDKAHERSEEEHQQVANILESPSAYMQRIDEGEVKLFPYAANLKRNNISNHLPLSQFW